MSALHYVMQWDFVPIDAVRVTPASGASYVEVSGLRQIILQGSVAIEDDESMFWEIRVFGFIATSSSAALQVWDETNSQEILELASVINGPWITQGPLGVLPTGDASIVIRAKDWDGDRENLSFVGVRAIRSLQ